MYYRIKNKFDMEIIRDFLESEKVDLTVVSHINDLVSILDGVYGECRGSYDMGGYILLFTDTETYRRHISKIMEFYHLKKDLFEYSEQIVSMDDGVMEWQEELFLLSSEDSLVLIYPKDSDGC